MIHLEKSKILKEIEGLSEEDKIVFIERKDEIQTYFKVEGEIFDFNEELTAVLKEAEIDDPEEVT